MRGTAIWTLSTAAAGLHRALLVATAAAIAVCACARPEARPSPTIVAIPRPAISTENFPRLDSSTSAQPIVATIACHFLEVPCRWQEWLGGDKRLVPKPRTGSPALPQLVTSGTHGAYVSLIQGESNLVLVARAPSSSEVALASIAGVSLDVVPVALDAFVFILNDDNPLDGLSTAQIRDIYTGKATNWSEVGGEAGEIHPYQRDDDSGSQELMLSLVMHDATMVDAPHMVLPTMMAPFNAVSMDALGIGYSVFYYEENMAPTAERVKPIAVDGVHPSAQTLRDRSYPYTTEVYAVIRDNLPQTSLVRHLRDWLLSPDGQALIAESGYVPVH